MPDTLPPLLRHPTTAAPMISRIDAGVTVLADDRVAFRYCLRGDMARVRVPTERAPDRIDLLWEHTCFEAFVGIEGEAGYREFNFSPSGQWAAYDFKDYRQRIEPDPTVAAPVIATCLTEGRLELEAVVRLNDLPANPDSKTWHVGLSAVVEATDTIDGGRSYWALQHPAPQPDFHQRAAFTLVFDADQGRSQNHSAG